LIETIDLETNFYTYEGIVRALDKVGLAVDRGTTFGLVGESGCGKSVTVRSMMRIIQAPGRVDAGQVLFYTDDADQTKPQAEPIDLMRQSERFMQALRGDRISMIFQEPGAALNPIMRVGDQVAESFMFHRKREMCRKINADLNSIGCSTFSPLKRFQQGVYAMAERDPDAWALKLMNRVPFLRRWDKRLRKEASRRAVDMIAKLGIANAAEIAAYYPHNLSGGMKQRIVIAIALACSPMLLIADEATSNLDVTIQAQILDLLRSLKGQAISSVLLITHDLGIVAEACDRVGVMYAGNLCEVADVRDLFDCACHPYSKALLESVPRLSRQEQLHSIEGSVPNLVSPPPGCRFHPRCKHAMTICSRAFPKLIEVGRNHWVACYLYTDQAR